MGKFNNFNHFDSTNEIYDRFSTVTNKIHFEDRLYEYERIAFKGEVKKHIYRCKEEQHNLIISLIGNVVVNVEGKYSVGAVVV